MEKDQRQSLDRLIECILEKMRQRELSDEYLVQVGRPTHAEVGVEEGSYGIVTVPAVMVVDYLLELQRLVS